MDSNDIARASGTSRARRRRDARARRGTTALELCVSTAILTVVLYFAGLVGETGRGAYLGASEKTGRELRAQRTLDRVATELALAARDTLFPVPDPDFGAGVVSFQQVVDIDDDAHVLGGVARLRLEYDDGEIDDGLDQDGDGLIDECRLVLTRDLGGVGEQSFTLCRDVSELLGGEQANGDDDNGNGLTDEGGFSLALEGDVLTIRLTLATPEAAGAPTLRTLETALKLRN